MYGRIHMSISSTRKISSSPSSSSKVDSRVLYANNHSQFVENIDTTNNVSVNDENHKGNHQRFQDSQSEQPPTDFKSATPDISTSIEALALSGMLEEDNTVKNSVNNKIGVYNNNQSIVKDEEIERTGRNYLKHFYEKNEHLTDLDEFV